MPARKRRLAEADAGDTSGSDSDGGADAAAPAKKRSKSKRLAGKRRAAEEKEAEEAGSFGLEVSHHESIVVVAPRAGDAEHRPKVACFDMDHTLVRPKASKFPKNRKDWVWMWPQVPKKLKALHADGFRVVIISNQNGIGNGKQREGDVTGKIIDLAEELGVPLTALLSTQKDPLRKPGTAMWDYFVAQLNGGEVDLERSCYVGDAAGRPAKWKDAKTKKDFSVSDRKFAKNCKLPFHTPEPYFLGHKEYAGWEWRGLDPHAFLAACKATKADVSSWFHGAEPVARPPLEMVMTVGPPGCGKSTFAATQLVPHGYVTVNRDTLKTQKKCLDAVRKALKAKRNVVVDATHPDAAKRATYLKVAKECGATARAFHFTADKVLAQHLNLYREKLTNGASKRVPTVVYNTYFKNLEEPDVEEGFKEVAKVDFVPDFKSDKDRDLFLQFTETGR